MERAERGNKDLPRDTLLLFVDLFELFVKILQILMKLKEDRENNERRRK